MNQSLNKTSLSATLHCLTGCSIGEILGMVISAAVGLATVPSIALSVILAFGFGYGLSMRSLMKHNLTFKKSMKLAFAADTASMASMEFADNAFVLAVPGAINAGLATLLFWWSLLFSLVVAFIVAFPLNRWLISRGKGHAVVHEYHHHHNH
ncbi:MAG: DUF4396 domain-containing protein [bacterium]